MAAAAAVMIAACAHPPKSTAPPRYTNAEQVEITFRAKPFVLGEDTSVALVRPPDWSKERNLRLPYWLGMNVLVPGVLLPKEGDYYVISEAVLQKQLDAPGEWLIEAGSKLVKQQAIYVTTKTRYVGTGKILPTIVQFIGKRPLDLPDRRKVELPVLREVSLPMKWTLKGGVPKSYARYQLR
ncbi:MAG: hypothetical protein ACREQF_02590 [Candidatus Binataceae bacterium]